MLKVLEARKNLNQEELKKYYGKAYVNEAVSEIRYLKNTGEKDREYKILRDTIVPTNNIYYALIEYDNGKNNVFGLTQAVDSEKWYVHPAIMSNPFHKGKSKKAYESWKNSLKE